MTLDDAPAFTDLGKKARKHARAVAAADAALAELKDAVRAADREGKHNRNEIIAASGLSRRTVYIALGVTDEGST